MSSAPRFAPSNLNWTPATPTLSEAVAFKIMVPATVWLLRGEIMETIGGVVSTPTLKLIINSFEIETADVVKVKSFEVARFPTASFDLTL